MQFFLVGGAVRDELLGRPVKDHDWVVVGRTPDEMIAQGFTQVGADFPVFLHPSSKDEYALARQERKVGPGYHGFETHFEPDVTLEDDLIRRDLTINAMAKDSEGNIIDPFGGQEDLKNGILRHVSDAFGEDPVRVLRVARFAARYDFTIHPDTMKMMQQMVIDGELDHLTSERVWAEFEKAMGEDHPNNFLWALENCGAMMKIFPELHREVIFTGRSITHLALLNQSVDKRIMTLCSDLNATSIQTLMDRIKAPNHIKVLTLKFNRFVNEMMVKVDAVAFLGLMKELDLFRHPDHLQVMAETVACTQSQGDNAFTFVEAFRAAQKVTFNSLSERQQQMLRGSDIGDAIDKMRLDEIKKVTLFR